MARPPMHDSDGILDAARALLLDGGPRAASVAAIAKASGAPVGTLYHRFGTRDELLAAVWLRAVARFADGYLAAGDNADDAADDAPAQTAAAMAAAVVAFARAAPQDTQLLLGGGLADLLDAPPTEAMLARQAAINAPLDAAIRALARRRYGRADRRHVDRVRLAVVDLPAGALRRWVRDGASAPPGWAEDEVARAAAQLL
ncbi:helix-turn-helix domain-containing protein [Baekduia sp. Peel2402]|uniref:helix-turn-helix domain-containing protein n=1 Tax=Baekduia sp. Peel2402 TaxID=3458296 RepID=UPI00403E3DDE